MIDEIMEMFAASDLGTYCAQTLRLSKRRLLSVLLWGWAKLSYDNNLKCFDIVPRYLLETNRFLLYRGICHFQQPSASFSYLTPGPQPPPPQFWPLFYALVLTPMDHQLLYAGKPHKINKYLYTADL